MSAAVLALIAALLMPSCPWAQPATIDEVRIRGPMPKELVTRLVTARLEEIAECAPRYRGALTAGFTIEPSDVLTDVTVRARPSAARLERCAQRLFERMRMPHEAGISVVTLEMTLRGAP